MARGPFYDIKPVYRLTFTPSSVTGYDEYNESIVTDGTSFSVMCHLEGASEGDKRRVGLDLTTFALRVTCADPMEGDARMRHGMTASITPDFRGLKGTVTLQGAPDSDFIPITEAMGVDWVGVFSEG